ncbi:MAG: SusC/RagA family TonB-linked outer membrane protein [Prevotella sp.]|nr:SusC/RagA family TonB-linked outer membrane protein [Candidatus Prevotella equi]
MKKNILSLIVLAATTTAVAQNAVATSAKSSAKPAKAVVVKKQVSGTVTDAATGKPLAGVSVQAYNNRRYTAMTDANGHYEISVPEYVTSLAMSVDGYQLLQKPVGDKLTDVNAKLYSSKFSDIYKKSTSAMLSASAENFDNTSAVSIDPLISQQLGADVHTINRSGIPGQGNMMLIDGINSLNAGSQPLVVIDGVIMDMQYDRNMLHDGYYNNILANVNVNDIERVTVLKNGTAIYGPKAANGVLLIDTKRNKSMATRIDVNINGRFELMPKTPVMMDASDYRAYATEMVGGIAENQTLKFMNSDPNYYYYNQYHNTTDWKKQTYHNAFTQNYGINVQGGDDVANYNLSVGYAMANSTLRGNDYSRFNLRLNSDISISRKLSIRFDASYSDVDRDLRDDGAPNVTTKIPQLATSTSFLGLVKSPFLSPYAIDLQGKPSSYLSEADDYLSEIYGFDTNLRDEALPNPNAILFYGDGKNRNQFGNRMVMFSITPRFDFNRYLTLSEHFTFTLNNTNENYYLPMDGTPNFRVEGLGFDTYVQNTARSLAARQLSLESDTRLTWTRRYDAHSINLFGGFRILSQNYSLNAQYGYNTGNDKTPNMSGNLQYKSTVGADDKSRDVTIYLQSNYNYKEKYYASIGLSTFASSRVGADAAGTKWWCASNPVVWGWFPSINGAWVMTNEKWLSNVKWLDYLRLNVGFDVQGNDNIDYVASRTYFVANRMFANRSNGKLNSAVDGISLGNIGNTSLKWETTRRMTFGLESNLFNNRLNVRLDMYKSWTKNLLTLNALSWTSGVAENWANNGRLTNKGIKASFNAKVLALRNLQWQVGASVGHYVNKVTELPENNKPIETNISGATILTEVGGPVGQFYGYKAEKVFATTAEAEEANLSMRDSHNALHKFGAGDVKFADLDGNNIIDEKDRTVIGNPNPDIYGNINTQLTWKNWSLSAVLNYSLGNDVFNYERMLLEGGNRFFNQTIAMNNRWKAEGQVTDIPRISYGDVMGNSRFSDRWIEDGSYLRLSNVTISYHIPISSTFIQGITVWGSGENLFTITRYLGSDPETAMSSSAMAMGIDRGLLARGRSFSLGVKVNL